MPHLWTRNLKSCNTLIISSGTHPVAFLSMTSILSCSTLLSFYPWRSLGSNISRQSLTPSQPEDPHFPRESLDSSTVTFYTSNASLAGLKKVNMLLTNNNGQL
jgi:hypothetical protein